MYNFKYKDSSPEDTIKHCKDILDKLNFSIYEEDKKSSDHLFSVFLYEKTLGYSSNGKGSTLEFARASAYAEFLERLQNILFLKDWNLTSQNSFLFYPDEVAKPWNIIKEYPDLLADLSFQFELGNNRKPTNDDELLAFYRARFDNSQEIYCANMYSLKKGEMLFPFEILKDLVYTTGMCAGNTPEEAISQGLSEIFERWVSYFIIMNNLTPPIVDSDFIKNNYPQQYQQIKEIESLNPDFSISVIDCSLGLEVPVVGILLLDKKQHRFRVQYGAHIRFDIALERCLTELLQGYDISNETQNILNLTTLDSNLDFNFYTKENMHRLSDFAIGRLPITLFTEKPSWEFKAWSKYENLDNKSFLKIIVSRILKFAPDIYIRDNSYLGFCSYYIYVPCLSTLPIPKSYDDFKDFFYEEQLRNFLDEYNFMTPDLKNDLCLYLINRLDAYPGVSNESTFPESLFKVGVLVENGFYEEALSMRGIFPKNSKYEIVFLDIKLLIKGLSLEQRRSLLQKFFTDEEFLFWDSVWSSTHRIISNLIAEEEKRLYQGNTINDNTKSKQGLITNFKSLMENNVPNQNSLKEIF